MTISITLPSISVPGVTRSDLRRLLPLAELTTMAVADACGVGLPLQITLGLGFKIAQRLCSPDPAVPGGGDPPASPER